MAAILAGFEILLYFFPGLVLGIVLRAKSHALAHKVDRFASFVLQITLYCILAAMGWRLSADANVQAQIASLGFRALLYAFASVLLSLSAVIVVLELGKTKKIASSEPSALAKPKSFKHLLGPLIMMLVVVAGAILTALVPFIQKLPIADASTWILRCMIASVGLSMGCADLGVFASIRRPSWLFLPFITAIASVFSGLILAFFLGEPLAEGGALSSGFGWYSLSAVLIADSGHAALGATAFLANLFRESMAILLIGFLQVTQRPLAAVSVAGATSMDVSLPLIALHEHGRYTALAVYHGFVLSLLVPLIVPVFLFFL